jgi:hypothetical protein
MHNQATTAAPKLPQQNCPLMKLPTELRIKIYFFTLQHTMHSSTTDNEPSNILTYPPKSYKITPFHSGAFALPHTNRVLRAESLDTLANLTNARLDRLVVESACRHNSAAQRLNAANAEGFDAFALALAESFEEAMVLNRSVRRLEYVGRVMGWTRGG